MPDRVLVTGAGGKTGRAVLAALTAEGLPARALVRDADRHGDLADLGDVEVVVGNQRDVDDLVAALDGCTAVHHLAPNVTPDEVAMGQAVIAACERVGVQRLSFHSVMDPHEPTMPHHADKGRVEELVTASSLGWTIVRPNAYLQNLDAYLDDLHAGHYRVPYAIDRGLAMVDLREVAEVVAGSLSGRLDGAVGAAWDLAGPELVTPERVAQVASQLLGHPVVAERQDPDAWAAANRHLPRAAHQRLLAMFRFYDQDGFPGEATELTRLLGRQPRDVETYLGEALRSSASER